MSIDWKTAKLDRRDRHRGDGKIYWTATITVECGEDEDPLAELQELSKPTPKVPRRSRSDG